MDIPTATTAGQLAAAITAANAQITLVNGYIANSATIQSGSNVLNNLGATITWPIASGGLTIAESAIIFNAILSILNARVTAWTASLTAIV